MPPVPPAPTPWSNGSRASLRLFPSDGVAYDAEARPPRRPPSRCRLGRDDASRTLVTPRPSLSLPSMPASAGRPHCCRGWPLARHRRRVAGCTPPASPGSLTWRRTRFPRYRRRRRRRRQRRRRRRLAAHRSRWLRLGADGGAAGGGGSSSGAPLLATTAELDATAAARAADVGRGPLALSLLQKGHGGHAATSTLRRRRRRLRTPRPGSPAAAEPAAAAAESARLGPWRRRAGRGAAADRRRDVRRRHVDPALGAVTADQPEALRHLIHDRREATLLPPALRTAAADLLPPIAVRSGGRGLHGAPPPLMPMQPTTAWPSASPPPPNAAPNRSAPSPGERHAPPPPPGCCRRRAAGVATARRRRRRAAAAAARDKFVADSPHLLPGAPPSDADVGPTTTPPRPPAAGNDADHAVPVRRRRRRHAARRAPGRHQGDSTSGASAAPHERERVSALPRGDAGGGGWRRDCGADGQLLSERRRGAACARACASTTSRRRRRRLAGLRRPTSSHCGCTPFRRWPRAERAAVRAREVDAAAPVAAPPCRRRCLPAAIRSGDGVLSDQGLRRRSAWRRACATRRRPSCGAACARSAYRRFRRVRLHRAASVHDPVAGGGARGGRLRSGKAVRAADLRFPRASRRRPNSCGRRRRTCSRQGTWRSCDCRNSATRSLRWWRWSAPPRRAIRCEFLLRLSTLH